MRTVDLRGTTGVGYSDNTMNEAISASEADAYQAAHKSILSMLTGGNEVIDPNEMFAHAQLL